MSFYDCGVSASLKNGPARNNLITNFTFAIEILRINDTTIQGIGKILAYLRSVFIMLLVMFANTLDFQKSLIASISGVINLEIHLIIELLFWVEHENEHLLIGRGGTWRDKGKIVSEKPSDPENFMRLFLLLGLVLVALLRQGYYRTWDSAVEDNHEHQCWCNLGIHFSHLRYGFFIKGILNLGTTHFIN